MKNRHRNHYFVQINVPDVYCLMVDWVGVLLDTYALTSVFRPPPPANVTVKYNNTLREKNFKSFGSSTAAVPARPFWIVVDFCCYIRLCVIRHSLGVHKRVSKLNRYNVYIIL